MSGARITYEEAIGSLRAMFPTVDAGLIEDVLRMNGGAMEPTIEQLLVMDPTNAGASPSPVPEPTPATASPAIGAPSVGYGVPVMPALPHPAPMVGYPGYGADQPAVMHLPHGSHHDGHGHGHPAKKWRRPLAADFLRIPGVGLPPVGDAPGLQPTGAQRHTTTPADQMARDAAMAAMLQNEVFIEQVLNDPELAEYILRDPHGAASIGLPVDILIPAIRQAYGRRSHRGRGSTPMDGVHSAPGMLPPSQVGPHPPGVAAPAAPPTITAGGGGGGETIMGGMQRRLNTLMARFQRQQNVPSPRPTPATGSGPTTGISGGPSTRPASTSIGGSWLPSFSFGGAGGRAGYTGLPTDGGGGEVGEGHVEIELVDSGAPVTGVASALADTTPGPGSAQPFPTPSPAVPLRATSSDDRAGGAPSAAFAIEDDDEDESTALTGGGRGRRV